MLCLLMCLSVAVCSRLSLYLQGIGLGADGLTVDFCKVRHIVSADLCYTPHVSVTLFCKSSKIFFCEISQNYLCNLFTAYYSREHNSWFHFLDGKSVR